MDRKTLLTGRYPDTRRIPELDGVRALMVFIVSWYHIWQQSWLTPYIGHTSLDFLLRCGYIWVDGTILLSGFLLFLPYARMMAGDGAMPDTRSFYRRRVIRIVPSYLFNLLAVLLCIALPFGLYGSRGFLIKDLVTHLTFTFNFWPDTYMSTPLGVACWTLAVEMQLYLLFPLLARRAVRHPVLTLLGMTAVSWGFRLWCVTNLNDYAMVVNQMPSFLDVYALGMAGSLVYVRLCAWKPRGWRLAMRQLAATALVCAALAGILHLLHLQAVAPGYTAIQMYQMTRRFPFALAVLVFMTALPFSLQPLRLLMGNRLMRGLGAISMNYYILHQTIAVHLKRLHIPFSESELPNQTGDRVWQWQYTLLCFGLSVLAAVLVTVLVEKPAARLLKKWFDRRDAAPGKRMAAAVEDTLTHTHLRKGSRVLV